MESNLLGQVRCASVNQEICVWVLGRTLIRMRVGELIKSVEKSANKIAVSIDPSSSANGVLLTNETEVVIAPRTRTSLPKSSNEEYQLGDPSSGEATKEKADDFLILRALPPEFFKSKKLSDHNDSTIELDATPTDNSQDSLLAFTSLRSFAYLTSAKPDSPTWSRDSKMIASISLKRLPLIQEGSKSDDQRGAQMESRLLHRSEPEVKSTQQSESLHAFLMPSSLVPDRDIIILNCTSTTGALIKSWELFRLVHFRQHIYRLKIPLDVNT